MKLETGSPRKTGIRAVLNRELLPYLAAGLCTALEAVPTRRLQGLTELRVRRNRPLAVTIHSTQLFVAPDGTLGDNPVCALKVGVESFERTLELVTQGSLYALQTELANGYLTLPGGHRVGLAGTAQVAGSTVRSLKHINSLNFRIARERKGAAAKLLQRVWPRGRDLPWNTLVFSGPGGGKTTLLRDLARQLSIKGLAVGIVDERSELAACYRGEPAHDVGPRTDVLDGCPKAEGMRMLLRSMGPQVLVTDELGQASDAAAVHEARTSGVSVIASAHAGSMDELWQRPVLSRLMEAELFECFIQLSAQPHPGTVCSVENPGETPV